MAIRIRHDAAALGSSLSGGGSSNRKYGQQLVMQQRKYDMDQLSAMQDRAFDMQKQQMQNAWQEDRDFKNDLLSRMRQEQEQDFRAKQVKDARDFELQDRDIQNRTKAFDQGRSQVTAMAMNALESGQLPTDVAKNLRELVAANTSVTYSPQWDEKTREQFIPQYNAQVSALLEQAGPPKSQAQLANQGLRYFDPRVGGYAEKFEPGVGMEVYDPETKMRWKDAPPQPQVSPFQSYYQENPNQFKKDLAEQMAALSEKVDSGEMRFFESEDALRQAALERMQNEFNFQQNALGMGQSLPAGQAAPAQSSTAPMSPQGAPVAPPARTVSPAVMQTVGNVLNTFPDTEMMAMSQLGREALVQNGMPQGGAQAPTTPIAPPMAMPTDRAGMVAAGMPQGGATAAPVQQPPSQNPWEEFVSPPQQQASVQKTESAVAPSEATVSAPDFKKLSESATDSADKLVLGRLQSMYGSQPLDIQKAISAFVDPGSTEEIAGQAIMYLKNKGIDILQLGKPRKRKLPGMSQ